MFSRKNTVSFAENIFRSSRPKLFNEKVVLKHFPKFGKHLCRSILFNKVAGRSTLLKKDPGIGVALWLLRKFQEHLFCEKPTNSCFWRKVCLYRIYALSFDLVISELSKKEMLTNSKWNSLWFFTIYYSLDCPCCFYSDNSTSACGGHFFDKKVSRIFIFHLASFAARIQTWWLTRFVCKMFYGGRKVYVYIYIYIYIYK